MKREIEEIDKRLKEKKNEKVTFLKEVYDRLKQEDAIWKKQDECHNNVIYSFTSSEY
jgi:predicted glycosyltransferase